jgi:hypothetical protein
VLSAEFQDWFEGLWQGPALAGTVAVLTVGLTLGFRFVASFPHSAAAAPAADATRPPKTP